MNLNPTEWSKTQDLLVKLVHALTPLTVKEVPASLFLSKRFYMPSQWMSDSTESPLLKQPIRLLTTLHSVQKEVEKWVEPAPQKQEIKKGEKREIPPVAKQAEKLIAEVQEAIVKLSNSNFVRDPKEAPLREALKKLKPELDRMIQAVAEDPEGGAEQGASKQSFRHPLPRSPREEVMKKLLSLSEIRPKAPQDAKKPTSSAVSDEQIPPSKPAGEGRGEEKKGAKPTQFKPIKEESRLLEKIGEELHAGEAKPTIKPVEITSLPLIPILPQAKELQPPRKKKKRKGFWFKEDVEERDRF